MLIDEGTEQQTEKSSNIEPNENQEQTTPEPAANQVEPINYWSEIGSLFSTHDKADGAFSARELAREFGVSDTAVRKAYKALIQVVSSDLLKADDKFTELGKSLMQAYFQRADQLTGAAWIHGLAEVVGALPEAVTTIPKESVAENWKTRKEELEKERGAIVLSAKNKLDALVAEIDADDLGEVEAGEAELELIRERAYEKEMARQLAEIEGRLQARKDIRKRLQQ
ncbi:hypothetical protein [Pseudanabaena sp. FACHB-2040]|uniref:hypothetical protein n=1 Tax=Pseudanabaena sp. FACHB-2040 TaxID=2692859 RepID=UPI0016896AA2|nr:hypothetical protein [Pseudanabaena sp. FACHB-2040]MBD2261396.1 hypothetical protein [Pseudanabaena sp. FACHB-2040]